MFKMAPEPIRAVQHFMKLAADHDSRNIVVAYYARMSAVQLALKIFPNDKPPEVTEYLLKVMEWLETAKQEHKDVEGITNETIASALIEEYILKLYNMAYDCDSHGQFHKNMIKAYYTTTLLCDVLRQFGELSEDLDEKYRISKYRAAYLHQMLKEGLTPQGINCIVVENDEEESKYLLTIDQLNARRIARGEEPLPKTERPPPLPFVKLPDSEEIPKESLIAPTEIVDLPGAPTEIIPMQINPKPAIVPDPSDPFTAAYYHFRKLHPLYDVEKEKAERAKGKRTEMQEIFDSLEPRNDSLLPDEEPLGFPKRKPYVPPAPPQDPLPSVPSVDFNKPPNVEPVISAPPPTPTTSNDSSSTSALEPDKVEKAMKYCKWASSALNYDDINTAIANLEKALHLCKFGKELP